MIKKLFLPIVLVSSFSFAQVGINTTKPDPSAVLDIYSKNKGIIIPRLTTKEIKAIPNPANSLLMYDTDRKCLCQNIGTAEKPEWLNISGNAVRVFYMPSISFDTSTTAKGRTKDLYSLYRKQFITPKAKSIGAPEEIPFFPSSRDFYYYVSDADPNVFSNISISEDGLMTYDVKAAATACSFINIVFVVK